MVLTAAAVLVAGWFFLFSPRAVPAGGPVDSFQEAMGIAEAYVHDQYDHLFEDYRKIIILSNEDTWTVAYGKDLFATGGGGPQLEIQKSNGQVISCFLQK